MDKGDRFKSCFSMEFAGSNPAPGKHFFINLEKLIPSSRAWDELLGVGEPPLSPPLEEGFPLHHLPLFSSAQLYLDEFEQTKKKGPFWSLFVVCYIYSQDLTACPKNTHFCGHGPKLIQFQNLKLKIIFIEAKKRPNLSNLSHHNWPE